jgi:hypothetical protein
MRTITPWFNAIAAHPTKSATTIIEALAYLTAN